MGVIVMIHVVKTKYQWFQVIKFYLILKQKNELLKHQ